MPDTDRKPWEGQTQQEMEAPATHPLSRQARYLQCTKFTFKHLFTLLLGAVAPVFWEMFPMVRVTIRLLISLMTIQPWRSALLCFRCREDRRWAEITEVRVALHVPSPCTHSREAMPEITAAALIFIRGSHNTALSHCLIALCQVFLEHCQSNNHSRSTRSSLWNKLFHNHIIWESVQGMCLAGALLPGFWSWTGGLSSYPIASNSIAGYGAPCCMVRQCSGLQNMRYAAGCRNNCTSQKMACVQTQKAKSLWCWIWPGALQTPIDSTLSSLKKKYIYKRKVNIRSTIPYHL